MACLYDTSNAHPKSVISDTHEMIRNMLEAAHCNPRDEVLWSEIAALCPCCRHRTLQVSRLQPDTPERWQPLLPDGLWWRCRRGCSEESRLAALEAVRRPLAAKLEDRLATEAFEDKRRKRQSTRQERAYRDALERGAIMPPMK